MEQMGPNGHEQEFLQDKLPGLSGRDQLREELDKIKAKNAERRADRIQEFLHEDLADRDRRDDLDRAAGLLPPADVSGLEEST